MNESHTTLSAITLHSNDPERLARFYAETVGLPFELHRHGTLREHFEVSVDGTHFAVLKANPNAGGPIVPVFRVVDLDRSTAKLAANGVSQLHKPMDIGEGKRVVTFHDPDGNAFRLIQID
jgi:predicted enzyme related to lactoylglutathione lyase